MRSLRPVPVCLVVVLCLGCLVSAGCRRKSADSGAAGSTSPGGSPTASSGGLDGTWKPVSVENSGEQIPIQGMQAEVLTIISGNRLEMKLGNRIIGQGTITVDNSQQPKAFDLTLQQMIGKNSGKTEQSVGIYEITGDTLKTCSALSDRPRPKEFQTKGTAATLSTYRRVR